MDSLTIWRDLHPQPTRAESDAWLASVLAMVAASVPPSRVYAEDTLALWATQRGYTRTQDVAELVALCNRAANAVPAGTPTQVALLEAVYQFGGRNPTT